MYINDVIRFVRKHYPSEYDLADMYTWCNEVSAMLVNEERKSYKEAVLPVYDDMTVLLPFGVEFEHVVKCYANGREIRKADLRTVDHSKNTGICVPFTEDKPQSITVIYQVPYKSIRLVKYSGEITADKENDTVTLSYNGFIPGDTITIRANGKTISDVRIVNISASGDEYTLSLNEGALSELENDYTGAADLQRYVTDKTVCSAPYDVMYEDYVLARICYFQRDTNGYNQHISAFNSRLADYRKWLSDKLPYDNGQFINYW